LGAHWTTENNIFIATNVSNGLDFSTGNIASGSQMSQRHLAPKINFSIKLKGQVVLKR